MTTLWPFAGVEVNCIPSLGYRTMANEAVSMDAITSWKVFLCVIEN